MYPFSWSSSDTLPQTLLACQALDDPLSHTQKARKHLVTTYK